MKGCLVLAILLPLLFFGGCQIVRSTEKSDIVDDLPKQLKVSELNQYDVCSRVFGGYSYIASIPEKVSKRIILEKTSFLAGAKANSEFSVTTTNWIPSETLEWDYDGPPIGLLCLRTWTHDGKKLSQEIFKEGGFYGSFGGRGAVYVVPSLDIVVGGFDPR